MERTIQAIFRERFERYEKDRNLPPHHYKAANSFIACRTATLGGHVQRCESGHIERVWYNSCKHRSCAQCNAIQSERWLEAQRSRLLDCAHRHLIVTVPHEFNVLWLLNPECMMQLLFRAVRDALMELLGDERHLGAMPGMVLALHTWVRGLGLHVHIHCLITDGGIDARGEWKEPKRRCFLPRKVVMSVYRGKFRDYVLGSLRRGELRVPEGESERTVENGLNRLGRSHWHVEVRDRYGHGVGVATYLARYIRGGPLRNRQLVRVTDDEVVLRYKRHNGEKRRFEKVRLESEEFMRRYLWHVPAPGRQVVRGYGLYSNAKREALDGARALFGQAPVPEGEFLDWQRYLAQVLGRPERTVCSRCGARLLQAARVAPAHDPPRLH